MKMKICRIRIQLSLKLGNIAVHGIPFFAFIFTNWMLSNEIKTIFGTRFDVWWWQTKKGVLCIQGYSILLFLALKCLLLLLSFDSLETWNISTVCKHWLMNAFYHPLLSLSCITDIAKHNTTSINDIPIWIIYL